MSTQAKIKSILESLISLPNAPQITPALILEYHAALGHWSDEILEMAALHYRSTETFFPTAGVLNNKVLDMQMLAAGIPTAGEAWSQVLTALRYVETVLCEDGNDLRLSITGTSTDWIKSQRDYDEHRRLCQICKQGGLQEVYSHPVVAETVRLLGGRDVLMTDNPAADRKQFIDAYRERVAIEGRKFIMPPQVKEFIQEQRAQIAGVQIKQLTKGMTK
jgi:hypothetical protein